MGFHFLPSTGNFPDQGSNPSLALQADSLPTEPFLKHWTTRRSNQSILKEISPEYSLEGLMLKLKLQYFGHLMRKTDSLEKTLMLGKIEGGRRRGRQRMRWLASLTRWTWVWVGSRSWWWTGTPGVLQSMGWQKVRHDWATELNWPEFYCDSILAETIEQEQSLINKASLYCVSFRVKVQSSIEKKKASLEN